MDNSYNKSPCLKLNLSNKILELEIRYGTLIIMIFMVYADKILMNIIIIESAFKRNLKFSTAKKTHVLRTPDSILITTGPV
jgi:hypothetical protein